MTVSLLKHNSVEILLFHLVWGITDVPAQWFAAHADLISNEFRSVASSAGGLLICLRQAHKKTASGSERRAGKHV